MYALAYVYIHVYALAYVIFCVYVCVFLGYCSYSLATLLSFLPVHINLKGNIFNVIHIQLCVCTSARVYVILYYT